ncbi:metallophosphoesterase family protein [Salinibacter altiplanensis]|uniref:metallophosphoesterase family protein n=1 Tax=Salinibacter altiplanensis TaxID=1803181 RepID=UPI001E5C4A38|nr:exonuclease SbcCD subunit D [Salinibacter altiplanensis]
MRLLHTADIHLGFKTHGQRDSDTGLNTRLLDVQDSLEAVVQRALDADVDAFLFCGDAYHTADPTPTQQDIFVQCLRPLADADIPVVLIVGNHDHPVTFGRASSLDIFDHIAGEVYCYRRPASNVQVIDTKSGPLQLVPLPWPIRSQILAKDEYRRMGPDELRQFVEEHYVTYVQRRAAEIMDEATGVTPGGTEHALSPDVPTVLAGHVTVQGAALSGSEHTTTIASEPMFTVGQLAVRPIDYVALGHVHQPQNRNEEGHPPVVYSGSIERVTFNEAGEDKGVQLVDIDPERDPVTRTTFVETPARPFVAVAVDARDADDPTEQILSAIRMRDVTDAIVRVRYRVREEQVAQVESERLREALAAADTVAGIERTVDPADRKRRTAVTRASGLEDAVRQYVGQHDELSGMEEDLVEAALALEAELDANETDPG